MTAVAFHTRIEDNDEIAIPSQLAERIPKGKAVRALITFEDPADEESAWRRMTQECFFNGYAESDSVYDQYDQLRGR
jgi:hypothetical protein